MTRAVFLGSPAAAVPSLRALTGVAEVTSVVTNPDRPRGRSGTPQPTPVKDAAAELGIAVEQPASHLELLSALIGSGAEVGVVVAYGRIIRPEALRVPAHGFVNVHFSLLPRWRGASPVVRSILAGDDETGVTIMQLDEGMDTGPILAMERTTIGPSETAGELTHRLARIGADLLADTLPRYVAGDVEPRPQPDDGATAAGKVTVDEAHLSPLHGPDAVLRAVRAFAPRPGAWTEVEGERFKIWSAVPTDDDAEPGRITERDGRVLLGLRRGSVELLEVQPPGKPRMDAGAWMNGRRGEPAEWGA
ncbi:MAG: methionyl-tRNA formyltransferase [Acidimicrobiia bacterium]|nr:methionyl-tRNA formyltransferase [Acidimicrobiia bacterium]